MSTPKFWIPYLEWDSIVADRPVAAGGDVDVEPEFKGIYGGCEVTAYLSKGDARAIRALTTPKSKLYALGSQDVRLDDGFLSLTAAQEQFGLLAKSDVLDLDDIVDIVYSFRFHHVTYNGKPQDLPTIVVKAPELAEDVIAPWPSVNLADMEWLDESTAVGGGFLIRQVPDDVVAALSGTAAQFMYQGQPVGEPLVLPSAAWGSLLGKPGQVLNILDGFGVTTGTTSTQTAAIKTALDANSGKAFYFPPGDYRLDTQLNITANNSIILAPGARIYAGAAMGTLVNYDNGQVSVSNWAQDKCIVGQGTLDGALLADKVLSIQRVIRCTVEGFTIIDGINRGLYTGSLGAEITFRNVRLHNTGTTNVTDNIAVEANMGDCSFQDFIIRDWTVGVRDNGGNVWSNVHPWIGTTAQLTARYANSIGFDLNGGSCVLTIPYADTFRTQFKVRASAKARITKARAYTNWGNLTDALAASYPGTILDLDATSTVVFTEAQIQGHPNTFASFITGAPTHLTAHTNFSTNWITGLSDYRDGVVLDPVFTRAALPVVFDAFTAADGTALDSAKWTVTTGGAAAAAAVVNANRARLTTGATGGYSPNDRVNVVNATSLADAEILVRHTFGTPTVESYFYYGLRISGSTVRSDSYCAILTQPTNGFTITKFVGGTSTDLIASNFAALGLAPAAVNPVKWVRFRVKGTTISLKIWDDGATEPVAWSSTVTDSSVTAAGKAGAQFSGGSAAVSGVNYADRWNIYVVDDDKSLTESIATGLEGKQATDSDLTVIAALTPSNDDVMQRKSGAWASRTIAQLKTDLGVAGPNVQVFTSGGTWTKPAGAVSVYCRCQAPGSGGGAGARGPSGTALAGGGAGAGGGLGEMMFAASDLTGTVPIGVGTGGPGAAGQTTDGTAGANGSGGSSGTNFGTYLVANRASTGGTGGGLAAGGNAGAAGGGMFNGGSAGAGSTSGAAGTAGGGSGGGGGGGAGGGITTGAVANAGGAGGVSTTLNAGAGTAGSGAAGGAGTSSSTKGPGSGGGGGGANAAGAGYPGGNGGIYGAGGGGGGAALNGSTSGAGGNGGDGICIVTTYF